MKSRVWYVLALALCCLLAGEAHAQAEQTVRRALLIGCDNFISQEDTIPSAAMNVGRVARMLETDARGYAAIRQLAGCVGSQEALATAIADAFDGSDEDDVSLLYICTHGLYDRVTFTPSLVLSDGIVEEAVTAQVLRDMLDAVPGTKVLVLDACNSGAFIGKGAWDEALHNTFQGAQYQVLTSAGARENSFIWHDNAGLGGGSYFAAELCDGLRGRTFDLNADGVVTLLEARQGLKENHGASTAQCYPEQSGFALYVYDPDQNAATERPISDLVMDNRALTAGEDTLYFSFTVTRPVRVQYQLIYYKDGAWRFDSPQIVEDVENEQGALLPGRKERSLTLTAEDEEPFGYVLLQIVAQEGRRAMLAGSRLISVQQAQADPRLRVWSSAAFSPETGEELAVYVRHDFPCSISVTVRDAAGAAVRRLAYKAPSRPLGIRENGSIFYWDGKTNAGEDAPAGEYTLEVSCVLDGAKYSVISSSVALER